MTDKTKTKISKPVQSQDDEFEFSIEQSQLDSIEPPPVENKKIRVGVKSTAAPIKKTQLELDEAGDYKPRATRGELYNELKKKEEILDVDVYDYANPILRGMAFVLDYAFYAAVGFLCINIAPIEMMAWDFFLNKYSLKLLVSREAAIIGLIGLNMFLSLFIFIAIPLAFFNRTFGKKLTGLYVRGEGQYTISIATAFKREVIWKPISLGILVGIVMPFFTKNKQSLHDKICKTIVIR